ncbi:hypothetical protein HMPREF1199_00119 [Hoylesella oralis CC98A]|nr:hypothetical protein HMPREF1199_00119 [Hoylesella oralis CC98A]
MSTVKIHLLYDTNKLFTIYFLNNRFSYVLLFNLFYNCSQSLYFFTAN